jgi:hypothetical protein
LRSGGLEAIWLVLRGLRRSPAVSDIHLDVGRTPPGHREPKVPVAHHLQRAVVSDTNCRGKARRELPNGTVRPRRQQVLKTPHHEVYTVHNRPAEHRSARTLGVNVHWVIVAGGTGKPRLVIHGEHADHNQNPASGFLASTAQEMVIDRAMAAASS